MWVPPRSRDPELMDRDGNPYREVAAALDDIAWVNRRLGGISALAAPVLAWIEGSGLREATLLDVGTGGGDIPRALAARAACRGIRLRAAGLDADRHSVLYASRKSDEGSAQDRLPALARAPFASRPAGEQGEPGLWRRHDTGAPAPLALLLADAFSLPFADGSFDFVTSSMMLHHFEEARAAHLLREMRRVARRAVFVNDLARHLVPWAAISVLSRLGRSRMFRHDAPLSVLRGWTAGELMNLASTAGLASRARVQRLFPYRLVLTIEAGSRT